MKNSLDAMFDVVRVFTRQLFVKLVVSPRETVALLRRQVARRHAFRDLFRFALRRDETCKRRTTGRKNRLARIDRRTLLKVTDRRAAKKLDDPFFAFFSTGKNIERRRFAAAVGTDKTDFIPFAHLEGDVGEYRLGPVMFP